MEEPRVQDYWQKQPVDVAFSGDCIGVLPSEMVQGASPRGCLLAGGIDYLSDDEKDEEYNGVREGH